MATKKDIKQVLKELNLTENDMQNFYNELIETNSIIKSLNKSGKRWNDLPIHLIRQLPTQRQKDLDMAEKKQKEEDEIKLKEQQEKKEKKYYNEHFEEIMLKKIDNGENLTEKELRRLALEHDIERDYGDNRRWTRGVTSIVQIGNRFFEINWEEGLTEYQENEFYEQPYEVEKHTYEKTITVTEWRRVENSK